MASILKFGERVLKTKENEHGWRVLYQFRRGKLVSDSLLGHKSVLCFTGDGGIYDEDLNGYCKNVQVMLEKSGVLAEQMPHIYALGFDTETSVHRYQILKKTKSLRAGISDPEYFYTKKDNEKKYWESFFEAYLLPLLVQEDGQARSVQEIKENLQNLTIVTHCHGGMFAHEIESELSNKLKELYPEHAKALMGQLRMLHVSSRKLILPESQAKHFHIISQNDDKYADAGLEYDHLHEALNREKMTQDSLLLQPKENEMILLLKQLTTFETFGENADDHSHAMNIFSGRVVEPKLPENERSIHLTQQLLKNFVLTPDDSRSLPEILKGIDADFSSENLEKGEKYFRKIKEAGKVRRGLLSILSNSRVHMVPTNTDRKVFLQRDDEGRNFYQSLFENYQKTGDSISLHHFLRVAKGSLSAEDMLKGIDVAVQRRDWPLVDRYSRYAYVSSPEDITDILKKITPEELPKIYRLLQRSHLERDPQLVRNLQKKSLQIKHTLSRLKMQQFLSHVHDEKLKGLSGFIRISSGKDTQK